MRFHLRHAKKSKKKNRGTMKKSRGNTHEKWKKVQKKKHRQYAHSVEIGRSIHIERAMIVCMLCCSVLQCVAVCCSVLQCAAVI